MRIDTRWWIPADPELTHRFAKELVTLRPDVILSARHAHDRSAIAGNAHPSDRFSPLLPIRSAAAFVASLAHPGGNTTGFVVMEGSFGGKWLELLKEIAPRVVRVAVLFNPATATYAEYWLNPLKAAAPSFALEVAVAPIHDASELEALSLHRLANLIAAFSCCRTLSQSPTGLRSRRWRRAIVFPPFMRSVISLKLAACCPMEMTKAIIFGAQRSMPIAF